MRAVTRAESALAAIALASAGAVASAQDDLTLPPRLDEAPVAAPAADRPGTARLAARPEARGDTLEEVVVVGEKPWRMPDLPDLGSDWRQAHAQQEKTGRIRADFLHIYDPERPTTGADLFLANREIQRVGFIDLFRIRFGGRSD
jgi:hypothetical protein